MIKSIKFNDEGRKILPEQDWPVVYVLNNEKSIYIGETSSIKKRFGDHLIGKKKDKIEKIHIINDSQFNKSAVLDIEQNLIKLCNADKKFKLLNLNSGQSSKHNYYQRELYLNKIEPIWNAMIKRGLADNSYIDLMNTDLFKYSPYTSLTQEQYNVSTEILNDLIYCLNNNVDGTSIVRGGAGTGKTVLAISLIFKIIAASNKNIDFDDIPEEDLDYMGRLIRYVREHGELKVGFVVPMTSLRNTLSKVFSVTKNGLKSSHVIGPSHVVKQEYEILIVDESHRLSQNKNLANYSFFNNINEKMGNPNATQLDWVKKHSKYTILFYDEKQTVKGSDISSNQFWSALEGSKITEHYLQTQLRCKSGNLFSNYLSHILNCENIEKEEFEDFTFTLYDNINKFINFIKEKNNEVGLSRVVSGISWNWNTKEKTMEEIKKDSLYDILIDGTKLIWNRVHQEWILREESINEIGCIHTVQGYDLNYVGVIFGKEIDYNPITKKIEINKDLLLDRYVKAKIDDDQIHDYVINSYKVLLTRGIRGCVVYAYNTNLREYFKKYINKAI